jgi:ribosomal protein S18 acetylase RimI-like enzyme
MFLPNTHFRHLHPPDAPALEAFFADLVASGSGAVFHPHPLTLAQAEWLCCQQLRNDIDEYRVAVEDGRIVAYGLLRGWAEGYEIPSLGIAVRPCCRGRGIARRFMHLLHDVARGRGASTIRLKVYRDNLPALRLYQSLGYELSPHSKTEWLGLLHLRPAPAMPSRAS